MEVDNRGTVDIPSSEVDVEYFVKAVEAGIISYPYRRYYLQDSPEELFKKLKTEVIEEKTRVVTEETLQTKGVPIPADGILVLTTGNQGEALTDCYSEDQRAKGRVANGLMSRYQLWKTMTREIVTRCMSEYERVNTFSLRETIKRISTISTPAAISSVPEYLRKGLKFSPETNNFSNSLAREIYDRYCPKGGHVLDTSAGWGDRALAACASKNVAQYDGIDPNEAMVSAYSRIRRDFGNGKILRFFIIGAQELPYDEEDTVDLVFTSPPYLDLETYSSASSQSTSISSDKDVWMELFMREQIERALYRLKKNGLFMLHIRDIRGHELVRDIYDIFEKLGVQYEGVIGIVTRSTVAPVWMWRK